jgi:hypothetical protein
VQAETRGPFEPLLSSSRPPSDPAHAASPPSPSAQDPGGPGTMAKGAEDELMPPDVLDKHFDQLLAPQRELISEYFKQSDTDDGLAARGEARGETQAEAPTGAELAGPGAAGHQPDAPPGASVAADQPRVW